MKRWTRAAVVAALLTALTSVGSGADAQTEGAFSSNIFVTAAIRGAAPQGTQFVVSIPGSPFEEYQTLTFGPGDLGPKISVETDGSGEAVSVTADGGADGVAFECTSTTGSGQCSVQGDQVVYGFPGDQNSSVNITITFTFGTCGGRAATVLLGDGDTPTAGDDVILGTPGANTVNGLGGDDRVCGGGGPDTLRGGGGTDRLFGGNGADRLEGGLLGDQLFGQNGNDTLLGQDGTDRLDGGANRDTCNGGPGVDQGPRCEVKTSIP